MPRRESDTDDWAASALGITRLVMPVVLLALLARLWLQTWQAFGSDQPLTLAHAVIIITETPWGTGWLRQLAASLAAWIVVALASPTRWLMPLLAAGAVGGTVGMTGHAAGADSYARLLIIVHGLHVLAAGLWLGTLAVVLRVTRPSPSGVTSLVSHRLAPAIDRFSPQAIACVAVLATSGVVAAWQHIGGIAELLAFGAAALCGLYNWRVVRPSLGVHPDGASHLRSMAALELSFGFAALVLTTVLTSMPMPTHD